MPTREAPPPAVRANSLGDHSSSSPVSRSNVTASVMRAGTTISDGSDTRESAMAVYISILRGRFIREAVQPALARLRGGDHGVAARPRVLARVPAGRRVAATRAAAGLARPQVHPRRADEHALVALARARLLDVVDGFDVRAGLVRHGISLEKGTSPTAYPRAAPEAIARPSSPPPAVGVRV